MTTEVIIKAHVSPNKEVHISYKKEPGQVTEFIVLQDGEEYSLNVFDDREVSVREMLK